ncbi:transposase [Clostridium sp.]|uniref:transposase n=1 Tax=Clostridium sp. TaxID=1506 RepID=UPI001A48B08F|nr:transposase [Clostridium sp.]MBK5242064.1 transposase [Clostridium sp.]
MTRKGIPNKTNKYATVIQPRLLEIQKWCEEGLTNDIICQRLGIPESTWYDCQKNNAVLLELVHASKSVIDTKVENALLKTALGYEYEEIKTVIEEDKNGKKRTRIEKTKKYMPPNPTAQAFWLKNRKRDEWSERKEIIFDTKAQEEERKRLFLNMINDEVVDADYNVADETVIEGIEPTVNIMEETEEGFVDELVNTVYNEGKDGFVKTGA